MDQVVHLRTLVMRNEEMLVMPEAIRPHALLIDKKIRSRHMSNLRCPRHPYARQRRNAVGQDLPDNQSGYRLVDKELIPLLLESKEAGYNFLVEMIVICLAQGWEIGWVPISTIYGDERSHQNAWYQIKGFTRMCIEAHRKIKAAEKERKND